VNATARFDVVRVLVLVFGWGLVLGLKENAGFDDIVMDDTEASREPHLNHVHFVFVGLVNLSSCGFGDVVEFFRDTVHEGLRGFPTTKISMLG